MQKSEKIIYLSVFFVFAILISSFSFAAENDSLGSASDNDSNATDVSASVSADVKGSADVEKSSNTEDENSSESDIDGEIDSEAQLSVGAGITPDSNFYWVEENILSKLRSDITNLEKAVAQIKAMVEKKDYESARVALSHYKKYVSDLEENVAPEEKEEVQRAISAISNALKEIESQIPQEQKKEFVDDVKKDAEKVQAAVNIAAKIKELCGTLAKLDPEQYAITCNAGKDAPKWQRNLDDKLTDEQKKEAEAFFKIMSSCFENPKTCQCSEIKIQKFADSCNQIAPLAAKCQEGDDDACEKMDEIEDPIEYLPPHLQGVMEKLDRKYSDDKFEHFGPPECKKAGVTTKEACMKIMFEKNAPEECIDASKEGKIDFSSERTMRESCEKIMFLENAPQECVNAGLKDHKECGKFMFKQNAPEECIDAGLTGESPRDSKKCEEIMRSQRENEGPNHGPGGGFAFGRDCGRIENKEEKLKCFEDMFNNVQQGGFQGRGPEERFDDKQFRPNEGQRDGQFNNRRESEERNRMTKEQVENFAKECSSKGGRWDCSFGGSNPCRCFSPNEGPRNEQFNNQQPPDNNFKSFQGERGENFQEKGNVEGGGIVEGSSGSSTTSPSTGTSTDTGSSSSSSTSSSSSSSTSSGGGDTSSSTGSTSGSGDTGSTSSGSSSGGDTSTSSGSSSGGTITGGVIAEGNAFLDYYFK